MELPADEQCMGCWGAMTGVVALVAVKDITLRFCGNCLYDVEEMFGPLAVAFRGPYADFNAEKWDESEHGRRGRPIMIGRK